MHIKIFTLAFDPRCEGFDDEALRNFIKDKQVNSLRDHFFVHQNTPYLCVIVNYSLPLTATGNAGAGSSYPVRKEEWRRQVRGDNWPLFNTLRDWRGERGKKEGVPPYLIATNKQLAAIVETRPHSLSQLAGIQGIGKAKIEKYGKEILELVAAAPPSSSEPAVQTSPDAAPGATTGEQPWAAEDQAREAEEATSAGK